MATQAAVSIAGAAWFRITLHRSGIGLPERTRGVLSALGLRRRGGVMFQPVTADLAGMIMKVKELVRVEEVDRPLTRAEVRAERRPDPGFEVESTLDRRNVLTYRHQHHHRQNHGRQASVPGGPKRGRKKKEGEGEEGEEGAEEMYEAMWAKIKSPKATGAWGKMRTNEGKDHWKRVLGELQKSVSKKLEKANRLEALAPAQARRESRKSPAIQEVEGV